jgi:signal transduction histidine kinase
LEGNFGLDRQGRIVRIDERSAQILGVPGKWLLGRSFLVFVARQNMNLVLDALTKSLRNSDRLTMEIDLNIGFKTTPVQLSIRTSIEDTITHHLTVVDLSRREAADQLTTESLSNWYLLVHNAADTILTLDMRGRIGFINKPLWGYSISAVMGTPIFDYLPESVHADIRDSLNQAFRSNKRSMCDVAIAAGESTRWFSFSFGTPHPQAQLPPTTTTVVMREISEHKATEESLRASGKQFREFAAHAESVREEERSRVGREIHDELGQALTALKLDLAWIEGKTAANSAIKRKMKDMAHDVDAIIDTVRRISSELRPPALDDLGLIPALEWQLVQFRKRTRIRTEFLCAEDDLKISGDAAGAIFRVVQEALTNVMRHANATRVSLSVQRKNPNLIRFVVADNGLGLAGTKQRHAPSLGIVGMKERISRLHGDFTISSEPGKGTRVAFTIPIAHD